MTDTYDVTTVEPVSVHVASMGQGAHDRRRVVTIYKTIVLTADNPYDQFVIENPNRKSWTLVGGQQNATLAANDICIGSNQGDIQALSGKAETLIMPGKFIPAQTLGYEHQEFYGMNPVWGVALGTAPTFPMYLGIADHVYLD